MSLRPEIPPWLACPQTGPPLIHDLTTIDFQQNPNPNSSRGPTSLLSPYHHHQPPAASPHISATALLQKAAQMGAKSSTASSSSSPAGVFIRPHHAAGHVSAAGDDSAAAAGETVAAGFGLNLSSRDQFINGLASFGNNKAAANGVGGGTTSNNNPNQSSLLHQMMINNNHHSVFEGSSFEDMSFAGILNQSNHSSSKRSDQEESLMNFHAALDQFSSRNSGINGGENSSNDQDGMMTRDFLGLRPLSQSDIMSIAGLSNCINNNNNNTSNQSHNKSWQG